MMRSLVIVSVVLGLAFASPILPRNPAVIAAETQAFLQHKAAADAAFVQEYNRLALLAANAPDIHIFTDDGQYHEVQPVVYQAEEVVRDLVEPVVEVVVQDHVERMTGHLAGHLAGHQAQVVRPQTLIAQEFIATKWKGPLADTIPAGVNGLPSQVTETPEVKAARQALVEAHAAAPQGDAEYNPSPADYVQEVQIVQEEPAQAPQVATPVKSIFPDFSFHSNRKPAVVSHNQAGHLAGHMAGQRISVSSDQTLTPEKPIKRTFTKKWEGPFADTVPAGVNGAPQQVTETPEVQRARNALYAAHAAVPQSDPLYN